MSRTDEIDKIVDEIGDADSLYEFAECVYEDRQQIAELEEQLKNATNHRKTHKNYSGFDLVNDLVKPCKVCGVKPQICDLYGYPEKYQIACMNCNCVNRDITSDNNFYVVIDLWNKLQGENK